MRKLNLNMCLRQQLCREDGWGDKSSKRIRGHQRDPEPMRRGVFIRQFKR